MKNGVKHCTCYKDAPFKVGDRVVTNYGVVNNGVVQTVLSVRVLPIREESFQADEQVVNMLSGFAYIGGDGRFIRSRIKTDGGALCKECGLRPGSPVGGMVDTWFRLATEDEIRKADFEAGEVK
jgi:hypothetical protein